MKLKLHMILFICFSIFFTTSSAMSKDNLYYELLKLSESHHVSSHAFQSGIMQSVFLIKDIIQNKPDVEKIKSSSNSLVEAAVLFKETAEALQKFFDANKSKLNLDDDIIKTIKEDSSEAIVKKINSFTNSYNQFAETVKSIDFTVYAVEGWANSGITVNPDDLIYVGSTGAWRVSSLYDFVGWKGYVCNSSDIYLVNENANLGELLYRVRGASNPEGYKLSDQKKANIKSKGRLEFAINDTDKRNNEGQLDLKIVYLNGEKFKNLLNVIEGLKKEE